MTLPQVIRIFFAVELPKPTKDQLALFINALKKQSKTNAIRWTKAENMHITLQFLAKVELEHLPLLIENVRSQLQNSLKYPPLTIGSIHLFPNPFRPRVIVLDVLPQDDLAALALLIGQGIQSARYDIEARPFKAHLTLGRIKYSQGVQLHFLSEVPIPQIEPIPLEEVVLFRSEPAKDGSIYSILERISLSKKALAS